MSNAKDQLRGFKATVEERPDKTMEEIEAEVKRRNQEAKRQAKRQARKQEEQ